jgi:hypothetical protein
MRGATAKILRRVTALAANGRGADAPSLRQEKRNWNRLASRERAEVRRNYERSLRRAGAGWPVGGLEATR